VIESTLRGVTVYIFLRKRFEGDENSSYAAVSFFVKDQITYQGEPRYWLLKEKIETEYIVTLYQKEGYGMEKDNVNGKL
jgi:hypothetical protein